MRFDYVSNIKVANDTKNKITSRVGSIACQIILTKSKENLSRLFFKWFVIHFICFLSLRCITLLLNMFPFRFDLFSFYFISQTKWFVCLFVCLFVCVFQTSSFLSFECKDRKKNKKKKKNEN